MLRFATVFLFTLIFTSLAIAGLDQDGKYDQVVAIYRFENAQDSGPRNFNGLLTGNASMIVMKARLLNRASPLTL